MDDPDPDPDRDEAGCFWSSCCGCFAKQMLLLILATGFIAQSCLVYSDTFDTVTLDARGVQGRRIWHRNNCQTCHQLHGFGGFLGPDLTNVVARAERSQMDTQLTVGSGQMPAFRMSQGEIDSVWAFLTAMNETGIGQARNPRLAEASAPAADVAPTPEESETGTASAPTAATPREALAQVIDASGDTRVAGGFELFQSRRCLSCHVFFGRSSIGAPDLSLSGLRLAADEIDTVLRDGRPPRMPVPALSPPERDKVRDFILFMAENRATTLDRVVEDEAGYWASLPWWEYE